MTNTMFGKTCYVLLPLLTLVSSSCNHRGSKSESQQILLESETEGYGVFMGETVKGLEMSVVTGALAVGDREKNLKVVFRNDTEYLLYFGRKFSVEKWEAGTWVLVPVFENFVVLDEHALRFATGGIL